MARKYRVRLLLGVPGKGGQLLWKDVQADSRDGAVAAVNDWFEKRGSYPEGTSCDIEAVMPWPELGYRGWLLDEGKDGQADFEKFCDRVYIKLCDSGLDPEAAGALLDKYGDTIVKDSFTNGRNAAETAAAVNSAHNDESKSESKKKEGFRLELIDTITVPMWLYDAYVMGKEYGGNLTFTEQEKLADFREKYGSYHLDNHDEEAQYCGTNEFDGMGGLCYDVDVYKRSSDESKKNESKDESKQGEATTDYGTENPEGFAELARRLEANGFNTHFDDTYCDCLVVLDGDRAWVVEYNTDGPKDDPEEPWDLFHDVDDGGEYIKGFAAIPDLVAYLKQLAKGESKDEASRQDFDIDCESCIQALDEMKKKVLEWKEQGFDGVDDPNEMSRLCWALRDVESKFEIR